MIFQAEQTVPILRKNLVSWIFDEVPYDQDQPVNVPYFRVPGTNDMRRRSRYG